MFPIVLSIGTLTKPGPVLTSLMVDWQAEDCIQLDGKSVMKKMKGWIEIIALG